MYQKVINNNKEQMAFTCVLSYPLGSLLTLTSLDYGRLWAKLVFPRVRL